MNGLNRSMLARQLKRAFGVLLVSLLMVVSVACSNPDVPTASVTNPGNSQINSSADLKPDARMRDNAQPKRGGMNGYADDTNANSSEVKAKTRALIDNAQQNVKNNPTAKDLSKKAARSAEDLKDDVVEGAENQKDDFVEGTKRGMSNLKENLDKASKEIPEVVKEARDNAKTSYDMSTGRVNGANQKS